MTRPQATERQRLGPSWEWNGVSVIAPGHLSGGAPGQSREAARSAVGEGQGARTRSAGSLPSAGQKPARRPSREAEDLKAGSARKAAPRTTRNRRVSGAYRPALA